MLLTGSITRALLACARPLADLNVADRPQPVTNGDASQPRPLTRHLRRSERRFVGSSQLARLTATSPVVGVVWHTMDPLRAQRCNCRRRTAQRRPARASSKQICMWSTRKLHQREAVDNGTSVMTPAHWDLTVLLCCTGCTGHSCGAEDTSIPRIPW